MAAAKEADTKRLRYLGPGLIPFITESLGRPGEDACNFFHFLAPVDPAERSTILADAWQTWSVLVQTHTAESILAACGAQN